MHELYDDPEVRDAVVERWGAEVAPGGRVDRAAVAGRAFAGPEERAFLEGLLWPRVGERMMAWRAAEEAREPAPRALVVEVPLLFEAGMDAAFDATIAVVADEEVRRERAAARGHEAVDERTKRQLTQDEKAARATYAVANSGTIEALERDAVGRACQAEGMSAQAPTRTRDARVRAAKPRGRRTKALRRRIRRRRLAVLGVALLAALAAIAILRPFADKAVQEIALPLRHEDIIRQQAADKGLDPSLIAGVIYVESRFRDQTSVAGAKGLMQILPSTADYIAGKSGGTRFEQGDLATPQINIAYGSWYLRYLLEPLRRQRDPRARRLQRRRGQGRRVVPRARPRAARTSRSPPTSRSPRRATTSPACSTCASATSTTTDESWAL